MNQGDQVKAKKFITTTYESKEEIDAWPGELGTIIAHMDGGIYHVQFGKTVTLAHASELEQINPQ